MAGIDICHGSGINNHIRFEPVNHLSYLIGVGYIHCPVIIPAGYGKAIVAERCSAKAGPAGGQDKIG